MAKRLEQLGMPMDAFALSRMPHGVIVQERVGYYGMHVFATDCGNTGFIAEVRVVCDSPVILDSFEVELPWCMVDNWLSETRDSRSKSPVYGFPGHGHLTFPANRVLNDRLLGRISRGAFFEGILIGVGSARIPPAMQGRSVKADLVIYDACGNPFVTALKADVATLPSPRKLQKSITHRVPLFSLGDRVESDVEEAAANRAAAEDRHAHQRTT